MKEELKDTRNQIEVLKSNEKVQKFQKVNQEYLLVKEQNSLMKSMLDEVKANFDALFYN